MTALDNSLLLLKHLEQYKTLVAAYESDIKNYFLQAETERGKNNAPSSRQTHVERFYAEFKEEKNMVKKIKMVKTVLTSQEYKYDRELNAASAKLVKGLEALGLVVNVSIPNK